MRRRLYIGTWIINGLATLGYLAWLVRCEGETLFYSRDGVLWLLPVLPLAFVFLYLMRGEAS